MPVEQLTSFLQESKESGVLEMYYAELAARLRRGELLGLKWEDIDLDRGGLWVKRHGARINGEVVLSLIHIWVRLICSISLRCRSTSRVDGLILFSIIELFSH